jgi:hypothetical protein
MRVEVTTVARLLKVEYVSIFHSITTTGQSIRFSIFISVLSPAVKGPGVCTKRMVVMVSLPCCLLSLIRVEVRNRW